VEPFRQAKIVVLSQAPFIGGATQLPTFVLPAGLMKPPPQAVGVPLPAGQ